MNIQYGLHPDEANVPASENSKAMEALVNAGLEEGVDVYTMPAEKAQLDVLRMKKRTRDIVRQQQEASLGGTPSQAGGVYAKEESGGWKKQHDVKAAMCEADPSDPYCDEQVIGSASPHYDRAKFGVGVEYGHGHHHDPVSNFDYTMDHLTTGMHDPHYKEHMRRVERMHDRIARVDPMSKIGWETPQGEGQIPVSFVAKFGGGVAPLNLQKAWDNQGFMGKYRIPPPPELLDSGHRLVRRVVHRSGIPRGGAHPLEGTLPSY